MPIINDSAAAALALLQLDQAEDLLKEIDSGRATIIPDPEVEFVWGVKHEHYGIIGIVYLEDEDWEEGDWPMEGEEGYVECNHNWVHTYGDNNPYCTKCSEGL